MQCLKQAWELLDAITVKALTDEGNFQVYNVEEWYNVNSEEPSQETHVKGEIHSLENGEEKLCNILLITVAFHFRLMSPHYYDVVPEIYSYIKYEYFQNCIVKMSQQPACNRNN